MALTTAVLVATVCAVATAIGTTTARRAAAEVAACYTIQQGDTAAFVSWRMTGSAQQEYQPWFQILDAYSRVVPKSQYSWIHAGWLACIPSSRLGVASTQELRSTPANDVTASGGILQAFVTNVAAGAWWGVAILVVMLLALDGWQYMRRRRAVVSMMQQFGERFVCEFERPLMSLAASSARSNLSCI